MNRRTYFKNQPLSNEEVNAMVPSAYATEPWIGTSSRYTFVPTSSVIDGMREAGFLPYNAQQARTRIPGKQFFTKHLIRFRPVNQTLTQVGNTSIEAILVNSHDGTSCYELFLGAFVLACLNGLVVAQSLIESVKIRHTGNIISDVVSGTQNLIARAPVVTETINRWKTIDLVPAEANFLAEAAHALRFEQGAVAPDASKLLQPRRYADNGTSLWDTFNRIQENVITGGLRVNVPSRIDEETGRFIPGRRNRTRAVVGIAENNNLNRALWQLAEDMAQAKGVAA